MRIRLEISMRIYRKLKTKATRENRSVKDLVLRGIERVLGKGPQRAGGRVRLPLVKSKRPGTLKITNAEIYDIILP